MSFLVSEQNESGQTTAVYDIRLTHRRSKRPRTVAQAGPIVATKAGANSWQLLRRVFLPAGYPASVSPDYLTYQIYNGLQAFCSSLAGLISSRAVLEGHGVGNASASATDAMLLNILQDIFSRLVTIAAGYYLGTSLFPEAKTYRLLADVFNDAAIILDSLSPYLSPLSLSLSLSYPFLALTHQPNAGSSSSLRVAALCLSGAFRALCGVAAGGSKAALTMHFAKDGQAPGDVGDLSAKDGSKETVLALFGMLCGSLVVPYLRTARTTYVILLVLLLGHLAFNYLAVRAIAMRSLNPQRLGILWSAYRAGAQKGSRRKVLSPREVAAREHIFGRPSALVSTAPGSNRITTSGFCTAGASFSSIYPTQSSSGLATRPSSATEQDQWLPRLLNLFAYENHVIWFDLSSTKDTWALFPPIGRRPPRLVVIFKEGHTSADHLKAWIHASEIAAACGRAGLNFSAATPLDLLEVIQSLDGSQAFGASYASFVEDVRKAGWDVDVPGIVTGSPRTIKVESEPVVDAQDRGPSVNAEDRKRI